MTTIAHLNKKQTATHGNAQHITLQFPINTGIRNRKIKLCLENHRVMMSCQVSSASVTVTDGRISSQNPIDKVFLQFEMLLSHRDFLTPLVVAVRCLPSTPLLSFWQNNILNEIPEPASSVLHLCVNPPTAAQVPTLPGGGFNIVRVQTGMEL